MAGVTAANNNNKYRCIVSNGQCEDRSGQAQLIIFSAGIKDVSAGAISMYPNPVTDALTIKAAAGITQIEVMNLVGKKVLNKTVKAQQLVLDMQGYAPGIYIIKINDKHVSRVVKK